MTAFYMLISETGFSFSIFGHLSSLQLFLSVDIFLSSDSKTRKLNLFHLILKTQPYLKVMNAFSLINLFFLRRIRPLQKQAWLILGIKILKQTLIH